MLFRSLKSETIACMLRGLHVRDDRNTMQSFLSSLMSSSVPVRVLPDDETDFLAPLIATALAKATPEQRIGFRVVHASGSSSGNADATSGTLFAYGRSVQITLTQLGSRLQKPSTNDGPNRHYASDATGLSGRELVFLPKEAQRANTFQVGTVNPATVVVDYELLATLPDQPVAPAPAQATENPVKPAGQPAAASAEEVEALKKELQEIKQQLKEQQQKKDGARRKTKPVP